MSYNVGFSLLDAEPCPFTEPLKAEYIRVRDLVEQQKVAFRSRPGDYERFYELASGAKGLVKDLDDLAQYVTSIEERTAEIVNARERLQIFHREAMYQKVSQLGQQARPADMSDSVERESILASRAIRSFEQFDRWRLKSLDGIALRHLYLLYYRGYMPPKSGRPVALFDELFTRWSRMYGVNPLEAAHWIKSSPIFQDEFKDYNILDRSVLNQNCASAALSTPGPHS